MAKTSSINDELNALRHRCTRTLFDRKDTVVIASISCIFGLGLPMEYVNAKMTLDLSKTTQSPNEISRTLLGMMYGCIPASGNACTMLQDIQRGEFCVWDDGASAQQIMVWPPYEEAPIVVSMTLISLLFCCYSTGDIVSILCRKLLYPQILNC